VAARGAARALAWLFLTAYGTAALYGLWQLEIRGHFGPSVLRGELRERWWTSSSLSHAAVAVVEGEDGPRLAVLMESGMGWDDPRVLGGAELVAVWTRAERAVAEPGVAMREVRAGVWTREPMSAGDEARLRREFLALQRAWGNGELVDQVLAGSGPVVVRVPRVVRWDLVLGRARGHAIAWGFGVSLLLSVLQALAYVSGAMSRVRVVDLRTSRLMAGLCPECEYPTEGLPGRVCPECGGRW
jgi:hypothetical protein